MIPSSGVDVITLAKHWVSIDALIEIIHVSPNSFHTPEKNKQKTTGSGCNAYFYTLNNLFIDTPPHTVKTQGAIRPCDTTPLVKPEAA